MEGRTFGKAQLGPLSRPRAAYLPENGILMKPKPSSVRPLPGSSKAPQCIICICAVLLGNAWNVFVGAPMLVTMTYLMVSVIFAILGSIVVVWEALRKPAD